MVRIRIRQNHGVAAIELAISFLALILVVFMLIDIVRFLTIKNLLESGVNQAMDLASYIPGLEQPDDEPAFLAARARVAALARRAASGSLVNGVSAYFPIQAESQIVRLPDIEVGQLTRDSSFAHTPIEISLTAIVQPLALPWNFQFTAVGRAVGFREPRLLSTNSIALDCEGRPFVPGASLSNCNCPANRVPDPETGQCICRDCNWNEILTDPNECMCECAPPFVPNPSGGCQCAEACPPAQTQNAVNCTCSCTNTCPGGQVPSGIDCICGCPGNQTPVGGVCQCTNQCTGGRLPVGQTCQCQCPPPLVWNGTACVCPGNQQQQGSSCSCSNTCPAGQVPTGTQCICACPSPSVWDPTLNACVCPGSQQFIGGQCVCTNNCPSGQSPQGANCACECPHPYIPVGGVCQCPQSCGPGMNQGPDCSCSCRVGLCPYSEGGNIVACIECEE